MIKPEISIANWTKLSVEQQALLKKLGVKPAAPPKQQNRSSIKINKDLDEVKYNKNLQPYVLCVVNTCLLCKERSYQLYEMQSTKKGLKSSFCFEEARSLLHIPFDPKVKADKVSLWSVKTCRYCRKKLAELKKEDLIKKLISAHN